MQIMLHGPLLASGALQFAFERATTEGKVTIGALVVALGFSLAKTVGGSLTELGALEAVGAAIMFAGFLSLGRFGALQPARAQVVASAAAED